MDKRHIVEMGAPFLLLADISSDNNITKTGPFAEMAWSTGGNPPIIFRLAKSKFVLSQLLPANNLATDH
jgi:hypothetical protein